MACRLRQHVFVVDHRLVFAMQHGSAKGGWVGYVCSKPGSRNQYNVAGATRVPSASMVRLVCLCAASRCSQVGYTSVTWTLSNVGYIGQALEPSEGRAGAEVTATSARYTKADISVI
jgi:hypothetical protein